jgi:hypothetical protein
MDGLEQQHAPAPPWEARHVPERTGERRAVRARHGQTPEDEHVVEGAHADGIEPGEHVALIETQEARRYERARLAPRRFDGGVREVDADDLPRGPLLDEPARHAPRPAAHVDHAAARHGSQRSFEQDALPLVPHRVERVGRPERTRHPLASRDSRVPVRRRAVDRVARATLAQELPQSRGAGSVGRRGHVASARAPSLVSMWMRARAASARAVASSRVLPWQSA